MVMSSFKTLASGVLSRAGVPRLVHRVLFSDKLTIVTYHGIVRAPLKLFDWCFLEEESFRAQLTYLKDNFEVISLSSAVEALQHKKINCPTAAITLDDGYQNNYSVAFPILRELGLPATIFLTTGFIDTDDTFWNLRLNRSIASTNKPTLKWNGFTFELTDTTSRGRANVTIRKSIRDLPRPQILARLAEIVEALGGDPEDPIEIDSPFRMLTSRAISEMSASGVIEFGAHSHSHPILSRLSETECRGEIELSVEKVRKLTGRPCELFAYPFGGRNDYNKHAIQTLSKLGIHAAVTGLTGPNDERTSPLELRRYGAGANESISVFKLKVHHLRAWQSQAN